MTTIIRCAGHVFRKATWAMDRTNEQAWICKECGFKVKTRKAMDYFTGKVS